MAVAGQWDEGQGPLVLGMSLGQAARPAVATGSAAAAAVAAEEGQEEGAAAGPSGPALTAKHPRPSRPVQPAAVFGDDDDGELKVVDWMDIAVREPDTPSLPLFPLSILFPPDRACFHFGQSRQHGQWRSNPSEAQQGTGFS